MDSLRKRGVYSLAGLFLLFVLVACGGNDGTATNDSSGEGGESGETTLINEITIMAPTFETTAPPADNEWEQAVEAFTGRQLTINWVPNVSYEDRMNVTLASTDIPHVMVIQGKTPGFLNSAEAGAFWELSDYLDDYEYLSQYNEDILRNASVNGNVYGLYRGRDIMRSTAIVRKDWLDNLGLDVPETIDDLYEVLQAFTHDDPDGNGADDTVGLIIPTWYGSLDTLSIWFGAPNVWGYENGEVVPAFTTDAYKASLEFVKKIVDEGLVNPDFTTLSPDDWNNAMFNGQGGVIIDTYSRAMQINNLFVDETGSTDPEEHFVEITGTIRSSDGEEYGQPTDGYSGFLAISKTSVQTEEELHEVLAFLDQLSSADGLNLLNHGIEGVNYELDDEGYLIPLETPEAAALKPYEMGQISTYGEGMHTMRQDGALPQKRYQLMEDNEAHAVYNAAAPLVSEVYTTRGTQLDDIIADARIQYVAGHIDEAGWDSAIDLWYSSGGQELIDELNELYTEMN
ncbi:putative aldouronate transport system substrate-binding protein [Amphibacillus marinus]|uniref:Putative aldouronate transport system substrate-binding protein n=1 Tax=Amphibacillus marinus TaxID=872970 RepID=A0A1H8H5B4_9BACI|nr:extracellular solute-binding protein [Amphibacillus marinus]SEN51164.1 putative aldouronate transport system substrate-binding protein [Amphibacillus marinus]